MIAPTMTATSPAAAGCEHRKDAQRRRQDQADRREDLECPHFVWFP
jgi:hypothetical protein